MTQDSTSPALESQHQAVASSAILAHTRLGLEWIYPSNVLFVIQGRMKPVLEQLLRCCALCVMQARIRPGQG